MGNSSDDEKWAQAKVREVLRNALFTQAKEIVLLAKVEAQALNLMAKRLPE
jgi:hypothetical protein